MSISGEKAQKIGQLTPLREVLAHIERHAVPVVPHAVAPAVGGVLVEDVAAATRHPSAAIALRDGFAVRAEETADGSAYAPAPLSIAKPVDTGDAMPAGTDAVALPDAVTIESSIANAVAPVTAGEGMLAASMDAEPGISLLRAGARLRAADVAALHALGISTVKLRRPRVRIVVARAAEDPVLGGAAALLRQLTESAGGEIVASAADVHLLKDDADLIIVIGGSGQGARDVSAQMLAQAGSVAFHGIGISPGETAALGQAGKAWVLIVPGRVDAALAVWATLGEAVMARLASVNFAKAEIPVTLARKIASAIGMVEIVLVKREGEGAVPLASGYLPLRTLLAADGYVIIPAESEGLPASAQVTMRIMP
jgi:molybdopterin biosynthesis enzyme